MQEERYVVVARQAAWDPGYIGRLPTAARRRRRLGMVLETERPFGAWTAREPLPSLRRLCVVAGRRPKINRRTEPELDPNVHGHSR